MKHISKVAHFVTLTAFVVVIAGLSQWFGHMLGLSGRAAWIGAVVAVVLDVIWLGLLKAAETALKARQIVTAAITAGAGAAFAGGSTAMLILAGHLPALSWLPVVALIVNAGRIALDRYVATDDTAQKIAEKDADHRAELTIERADTARQAAREVADMAADADRDLALAEQAVQVKVDHDKRYAALNEKLGKSRDTHGTAADEFREWMASSSLADRLSAPIRGPYVPIANRPTKPADDDADGPVGDARAVVDAELAKALSEPPGDDVMDVARAAGADRKTLPADTDRKTITVQVAPIGDPLADRAAQVAAERVARIDEVKRDGLTARDAAERFGVHISTARKYVADAKQ